VDDEGWDEKKGRERLRARARNAIYNTSVAGQATSIMGKGWPVSHVGI
jgi:hypothetical protein